MGEQPKVQEQPAESPKITRMIKIKAISPIHVGGRILNPGETAEATEAEAKEYCDRRFGTFYDFAGERGVEKPASKVRAVRL